MVIFDKRRLLSFLLFVLLLSFTLFFFQGLKPQVEAQAESLGIVNVTDNRSDYPSNEIPKYEKFEITFEVENTLASNMQLPYEPSTPLGVNPGTGISVDAVFTPDNWATTYQQPAFYYEEYDDQIKGSSEWFYPTGNFYWKVRFAPNQDGEWQFKLKAQDAGGTAETQPQSFVVINSSNKGFVKVSENDERYFEFDDGAYFPGLGYNMNYDHVNWVNPILDNQENFQKMGENGVQLVRIWLSEWGIYGSAWNPWNSINPAQHSVYMGETGINFQEAYDKSDVSMYVIANYNPCMFFGVWKGRPAVKRNTDYRVRIRYKTRWIDPANIIVSGQPYGFVAKTGGWMWDDLQCSQGSQRCYCPGRGTVLTPYQDQDTPDWQILEGTVNSGNSDFLPNFFLTLENLSQGVVYVDYVWIEEDLGDGTYGENIVNKPWMAHHYYFEQRNSYAFDKVLDLAKQYNVYIRPVILEKNDVIPIHIDYQGNPVPDDPLCWDADPSNDPEKCPGNKWFYGDWRNMTKIRWLQQAWWRYLQARWGYSTNIHSWELLNEGDPWNGLHYTQADELGKYMHCDVFGVNGGGWGDDCTYDHPNDHLVSTSNWHSFPKWDFWANPEYPDVDFADYHRYVKSDEPSFTDTANATYWVSMKYGAKQSEGAGKPLIRGEIGFYDALTDSPTEQFRADTQAVWLHNFIWGQINPGGMLESYWYENTHIYTATFDHRPHFKKYYDFIKDIPLNNGFYEDAQTSVSNDLLRVWGQKDVTNNGLHLWVQNKNHTWKHVVDGDTIDPQSGTITINGFTPSQSYDVEWWDTYQGEISNVESQMSNENGELIFQIDNLTTDLAIRILPEVVLPGDVDRDDDVDFQDLLLTIFQWLTSGTPPSFYEDINTDGKVNILDAVVIVVNYGRTR